LLLLRREWQDNIHMIPGKLRAGDSITITLEVTDRNPVTGSTTLECFLLDRDDEISFSGTLVQVAKEAEFSEARGARTRDADLLAMVPLCLSQAGQLLARHVKC
jgi:hypothetical protein